MRCSPGAAIARTDRQGVGCDGGLDAPPNFARQKPVAIASSADEGRR